MRVFSFCCQLWHIGAIIGFRISPLSLQVKVNTQDPTHGAAVSGFNESALPVQPGTLWVNGSGGGQSCLYGIAACVRCGAFRKTSFTRLVIFHQPLLFHPRLRLRLSLSFSFSPGPSLHSVQGLFWCQENTHKQAATCTLTLTHSHKDRDRSSPRHRRLTQSESQ